MGNFAEVLTLITPTLAVIFAAVAGAIITGRRSARNETNQAALYAQGRDIHVLVNNRLLVALQAVQHMAEALAKDNPDNEQFQFAAEQARKDVTAVLEGPIAGDIEQPVPHDSLPVQVAKVEVARQELKALPVVATSARTAPAMMPAVVEKVSEVKRDLVDIQLVAAATASQAEQAKSDADDAVHIARQATYDAQVATADAHTATLEAKVRTDAADAREAQQ